MRLRKLKLAGFKSFADRTEFEFDDGISCVVGPNGCGKSNIVDAVKWVLGEQSAKSLRGSEMQDVIFNGSSGRKAAGMAEVTLVFDNSSGLLKPNTDAQASDGALVSVTRRLYRSGQSEYLINKAPVRLKDIREMFMDTGVGRDAYSLIEQGRVEVFLQASGDERRAIFDEAAGISKYKARKREALRKIDRVEQNLLRLTDILGEVEKRLRSIKYQAGKARNYQAYTERLKELRSLHLLAQYHRICAQRGELQARVDEGADALSSIATRIDQLEAAGSAAEIEAVDLERSARDLQGQVAAVGGQIVSAEQRAEMLTARVEELGEQIVAASSRCEQAEAKSRQCEADLTARREELDTVQARRTELSEEYESVAAEHRKGELTVTRLCEQLEDEKAGTIDLLRRTAQLHNEIHAQGIRRENLHGQRERLTGRAEEIGRELEGLLTERAEVDAKLADVGEVLEDSQHRLDQTRSSLDELLGSEKDLRRELAEVRERRSGVLSRIKALQELHERLEGIGGGVRKAIQARRDGRLNPVRGMLGEFLQSDTEHAPIIEAALAGADEQLVVDTAADLQATRAELLEVIGSSGAVEVLCLDHRDPLRSDFDTTGRPDVLARAIDWVRYEPFLAPAMWRLLGRTLVVRTLDVALALAAELPGMRMVTLDGEVVEPDGRVRLGAANRGAGVITRRSELAELDEQKQQLDAKVEELEQGCRRTHEELEHCERIAQQLRTAVYEANTERVEYRSRRERLEERIASLQREQPVVAGDIENLAEQIETTVRTEHEARTKADELERLNTEREQEIERIEERIRTARQHQQELADALTERRVALASAEEKHLSVREQVTVLARQKEQFEREIESGRAEIEAARTRRSETEAGISKAREEVDRLYARQTELSREVEEIEQSRTSLQERIEEIRATLAEQRKRHDERSEEVNSRRVALGETEARIDALIARASDEMGMDLPALYGDYEHDEQRDWDAVEAEIRELRGKIERLGNVNLDAIGEQEELQKRHEFLAAQLQDIQTSRNQLTDLIRRINRQSREAFEQSFQAIRENFRALFRKLFGGGKADIILTDPEDVLESGIEVYARPPGKELRSLSLLSGGEKTLTALALMFSIFRSRPSPFCLLDEVDAALDEANTERFVHLVREFIGDSQFLIITHAKRTMSMASVLYGVTMQEPGVSRRISVRFDGAEEKRPDGDRDDTAPEGAYQSDDEASATGEPDPALQPADA